MSAFMPPAPPVPTPPALTVPVAYGYGVGGTAEGATGTRGSYGPVVAMLAVVAVLAAAALAVGRLCFGRRALGQPGGGHDLEAWVERTCGHCVGAAAKEEESGGGAGSGAAVAVAATTEAEPPLEPEGTERGDGISIAS
ncbi:unnamed protein product [Urochloa decumbens]|uniref:Uncharacterized protein n=1 Tax=Urochloa decumbens TaxID=240449 RepID=A0ABC8Z1I4_9POAL